MTFKTLTPQDYLNEFLNRADKSGDIKTKCDPKTGAYIRTPWQLCDEIVTEIKTSIGSLEGKEILVVDTVEFIPVLLTHGVEKCKITYIAPYEFKGKLTKWYGAKVINASLLEWENKNNMGKFDVVIGNPPYQSSREGTTATEDLSSKFVKLCIDLKPTNLALVIPSDWIGPNKSYLKNLLFKSNKLHKICLYGDKWFKVAKDTCTIFYNDKNTNLTEIIDIYGTSLKLPLSNVDALSLDNRLTSFLLKFVNYNVYLDSRWIHGNLYLNELNGVKGNDFEFIEAVGRKDAPLVTSMICKGVENTGYGKHKLVIPMVGAEGKIGQIKLAKSTQVGGHSVVFLIADSDLECINLKSYLESKVISMLIKSLKKSTPNSKGVFSCIPDIDLSKKWTDAELYTYFNITQEEIDYIEENIK